VTHSNDRIRVEIPTTNWHTALATAIKSAPPRAVIVVYTEAQAELGYRAAQPDRLNRVDLSFELKGEKASASPSQPRRDEEGSKE
jgi:hypothetical protein